MVERADRTPFVGRPQELAYLHERLDAARAGAGGLVLIAGEAGIGKTRLAETIAREAGQGGVWVLWGRAWEGAGAPAFWPWVQILRPLTLDRPQLTVRAELGRGAADIAQLVPEVRERLADLPVPPNLEPEQARFHLFDAVTRFLQRASQAQPLLLVLDDLHWADTPSLLLMQFLMHQLGDARLLVLGTYRDAELGRRHPLTEVLTSLRRAPAVERMLLRGLDQTAVRQLLETLFEQETDPHDIALAEALERETEGNPFFVVEIVRHLQETGRLRQRDGRWTSASAVIKELNLPQGVREVIGRRLSLLSETTNRVLATAAVLGHEFDLAVLGGVAGLEDDALVEAIEEALAAHVVVEPPARGACYAFSHGLVRQTLYEQLSLPRKQRLHRQVAETLEAVHARDLERYVTELAGHEQLAGPAADPEKAVDYSSRAGEAARRVFAYEEAAAHWQAALELMQEHGMAPGRRARLLEQLGDLIYVSGLDRTKGDAYLAQALQVYVELGEAERAAQIHSRLGFRLSTPGQGEMDIPRALAHFRAAEPVLGQGPERAAQAYLSIGLAHVAMHGLHPDDGLVASRRAMVIGERLGNEVLWANGAVYQGWHLVAAGRVTEGLALLTRSWETAERLNHAFLGYVACAWGAAASEAVLDLRAARDRCRRELAKPRMAEAPAQRDGLQAWLGQALVMVGELGEARQVVAERSGVPHAWLAFASGEWDHAHAVLVETESQHWTAGMRWGHWRRSQLLARLYRVRGEHAQAEETLREALTLVENQYLPGELAAYSGLALLSAETGRPADGHRPLVRCRAILSQGGDWRGLAGWAALAEAAVAGAERRTAEAEHVFAEARAIFQRYALPWEEAETDLVWGRCLLAAGMALRGREKLAAAVAVYRRIGAGEAWIARASSARAGPGPASSGRSARTSHRAQTYPDGLSEREAGVLRLLAEGRTTREIAGQLVLSLHTAERHVANIYVKIGAHGRAEATNYALRHDLI